MDISNLSILVTNLVASEYSTISLNALALEENQLGLINEKIEGLTPDQYKLTLLAPSHDFSIVIENVEQIIALEDIDTDLSLEDAFEYLGWYSIGSVLDDAYKLEGAYGMSPDDLIENWASASDIPDSLMGYINTDAVLRDMTLNDEVVEIEGLYYYKIY